MTTTEPGTALDEAQRSHLPRRVRQLSWRTWRGVLVRSVQNFLKDNCADWAAALTYYGVLALFPSRRGMVPAVRRFLDFLDEIVVGVRIVGVD